MVSTRNHPSTFPEPDISPSKALTTSSGPRPRSSKPGSWVHIPDRLVLIWLFVSLPLVIWDTGYVFGRPFTMPGGWLNKPLYTPYSLYGTIDYVYSPEAWKAGDGWTGAQSCVNVFETLGYLGYLYVLSKHGKGDSFGQRAVGGGWGGLACLFGFSVAIATLIKTALYLLIEAFSGFKGISHNDAGTIVWAYIIPNGCWIVFPTYMIYAFGKDILHGLAIASGDTNSKPARAVSPNKDD